MNHQFTLRQARRYRDKTMSEVAQAIGVTRTTYIKYEKHPEKINLETANRISDFLNFEPGAIIFLPTQTTNSRNWGETNAKSRIDKTN